MSILDPYGSGATYIPEDPDEDVDPYGLLGKHEIDTTFKLRRGTAAEWLLKNPVLASGEPGYETDTHRLKIGNGLVSWNGLDYFLPTTEIESVIVDLLTNGDFLGVALQDHINSPIPHPVYDDGPSLLLYYQNVKV